MGNKVYLIGAGPGSPDLITVRGLGILRQADTVIYDYLVDKRLLSEAAVGAELLCCDTLGKNRYSDGFLIHNEKISRLVIKKFREGRKVARLKNGDPSIFSRFSQELESLVKNKIEFEIVPGVTAAAAASALSGIPLTDRRFASNCVFVTGHEDPQKSESAVDWDNLAKSGTIVLYMAVENLPLIVKQLLKAGKNKYTAVAIVQDASLLTQRIFTGTLGDIVAKAKRENLKPPAIIIIGAVAKLEKRFNWLKKTKKILFTGISAQRFFSEGMVFNLALIKIEPLGDYREFDTALKGIETYDWIVFSSRYGAHYFFQRLNSIGYDTRKLSRLKVAAVGDSTRKRLLEFGVLADLVPKDESAKGLLEAFKKIDLRAERIFLPRSNLSDKGLSQGLKLQGARVVSRIAYKNVIPQDLPDLDFNFFDEIIFTSPSGVRNFIKRYGRVPRGIKVSYIGEVTQKEAEKWHLRD